MPEPRSGGAGRAKVDRRQQILTRGRDVFAKHGYHDTTVDDIVAAAGVARGTFYLYFADKRSLFEELVDRFFTRLAMAIQRVDPRDPARPVEGQTRDNIRRILGVLLDDRPMSKILIADAVGVDPSFDGKLLSFYDEIAKLFIESVIEGQSLGIVRQGDARLLAYFTMGGLKEVLLQLVNRGWPADVDMLVDTIYGIVRHGYLLAPADG
ncbi:MAG: TetR/AcrR family transcriptional regulator [Polyangiaceae bacterium]|jgi:AcrR family transcriptional regulator|nr:TetR/AcrR family transcriptional regulator [Polyangiaceae bacterium]